MKRFLLLALAAAVLLPSTSRLVRAADSSDEKDKTEADRRFEGNSRPEDSAPAIPASPKPDSKKLSLPAPKKKPRELFMLPGMTVDPAADRKTGRVTAAALVVAVAGALGGGLIGGTVGTFLFAGLEIVAAVLAVTAMIVMAKGTRPI